MARGGERAATDENGTSALLGATVRIARISAVTPSDSPSDSELTAQAVRRVLVVDDDEDSAVSLVMLLKLRGFETAMALDGSAAVRTAEEFRPHVALLDLSLPQIDGHEAARLIRALPGGERIVLIALTGWVDDEDRRRSLAAGFDHHLPKPVDFEVLLQRLTPKA